jgi:hypothetical protein
MADIRMEVLAFNQRKTARTQENISADTCRSELARFKF